MGKHRKGYILALLATVFSSFNFLFAKYALGYLRPILFCLVWFTAGSIYSLALIAIKPKSKNLRLQRDMVGIVLSLGITSALCVIAFFTSIKLLSPMVASLFNRMEFVFIVLTGVLFFGERFNRKESFGLAIVVVGLLIMNWHSPKSMWLGFFFMFIACIGSAVTTSITKLAVNRINFQILTFYRNIIILLILILYMACTGQFGQLANMDKSAVAMAVTGALFGPFLGILLYFESLRFLDISKSIIVMQVTPVFVAILAFMAFHTLPNLKEITGGIVILLGTMILITSGFVESVSKRNSIDF